MRLFILGSVKIDSCWRKKVFLQNIKSLEPISGILSWNFNIVGKHAEVCRREILKRYNGAIITIDNATSYHDLVKQQLDSAKGDLILIFLEDHLFVCPHKNLFLYLLNEFLNSTCDVLRITHLVEFWERETAHKLVSDKPLHKEYLIDLAGLNNLWKLVPDAYMTSIPGIFKKDFVLRVLENNKALLSSKKPDGFELYGDYAKAFLAKGSFTVMVPKFHVFQEVFWVSQEERAIDIKRALKIIKLRDEEPKIRPWRKIILYASHPRMLLGRIKRKFLK